MTVFITTEMVKYTKGLNTYSEVIFIGRV